MKIIDGKFGKKNDDLTLLEKLQLVVASHVDDDTEGSFVMLLDIDGVVNMVSDLDVPNMNFLLDLAKRMIVNGEGIEDDEVFH